MLRLAGRGFCNLVRGGKKVPFLSERLDSHLKAKYFFSTKKISTEFNEKLLSGKYYQVLGFSPGTSGNGLTDAEVKRQYLAMVKKYHSDGVVDPGQKFQNEQITKCIIQAFDKISSERIRLQIDKGIYDKIYQDEDQIAMKIYGKKFNQIKYELFKEGNGVKRTEFMEELDKIRKDSKYYEHVKEKHAETQANINAARQAYRQQQNTRVSPAGDSNSRINFIFLVLGVLGVGLVYYNHKKKQHAQDDKADWTRSKMTLGEEKIKEIERKSTELYEKKLSDLINSFVDEQPPSLKYPQKEDPQQIEQLIEFTIGPDISLYEVSSKIMAQKANLEKLKEIKSEEELKKQFGSHYNLFPLNKIKTNSAITLSLEAERCLQNIYIKVKDVADEIEEKGKYTPPKIFFRYFGYLMFQIRQKPLSLQNYRETEYISLFDLFFDYYSPIPVKRHQYNEYVVGIKDDDMKMFGQVHINNRKIPERYIGKDDKIVVMRDDVHNDENKNSEIWHNYYRKYMKVWISDYDDKINTEYA